MALTSGDLNRIKELIIEVVDKRFAVVNERFTAIDDRFAAVDERFEELARMIQNDVIANMATKDDLAHLATKDDIARLEVRLSSHDHRLDHIESHLADLAVNQRGLVTILAAKRVLTSGEVSALSSP